MRLLFTCVFIMLLLGAPLIVLASDITNAQWVTSVLVINTGAEATSVSVNVSLPTPEMTSSGLLNSTADDATFRDSSGNDIPFMPGYDINPWIIWHDSIPADTSRQAYLYTGNVTGGDIAYFPGDGGMTVPDHASLEPGSDFSVSVNGTRLADAGLIFSHKDDTNGGIECTRGTDNVTVNILSAITTNTTAIRPNAAGDSTQLTPSAGTNYSCAGDNNNATYVLSYNAAYQRDLYNIADHTTESGTINSVTYFFRIGSGSGLDACTAKPVFKLGASSYSGTEQAQAGAAATKSQVFAANPITSAAWTWDEIDNLQIGEDIKITGGGGGSPAYCYDIWLVINYQAPSVDASLTATGVTRGESDVVVGNPSALDFVKANSDYAYVADNDAFSFTNGAGTDHAFSIAEWVYLDNATQDSFFSKTLNAGNNIEYSLITSIADIIYFRLYHSNGVSYIGRTTNAITAYEGQWIRITATYNGSETSAGINIYINAVDSDTGNVESLPYTGMSNTLSEVEFGSLNNHSDYYLDGSLAEVTVWNVALTPAQVLADYQTSNSGVTPLARWRMNEGTGNTLTDMIGARNATNVGGDWGTKAGLFEINVDGILGDWAIPVAVPDSTADWQFGDDDSTTYIHTMSIDIAGVPVSAWEWEYGATFHDSIGSNDGTPTFRTAGSDADVTAIVSEQYSLVSGSQPAPAAAGGWDMITDTPDQPEGLYGEGGTAYPLGPELAQDEDAARLPRGTLAIPIAFGTAVFAGCIAFGISHNEKKGIRGSLAIMCAVIELVLVFWVYIGDGVIPGWALIPFGIASLALLVWKNPFNPVTS